MAKEKKLRSKPLAWLLSSTKEQAKDTGMAMVLICLLLGYWGKFPKFLPASLTLLLITMIWPNAFRPLAALWFGFRGKLSDPPEGADLRAIYEGRISVTPLHVDLTHMETVARLKGVLGGAPPKAPA